MKTEEAIKVTKEFIKENGITDEDMIQDLYLMSIEKAELYCDKRLIAELEISYNRMSMQKKEESSHMLPLREKETFITADAIYQFLEKKEKISKLHEELDHLNTKCLIESLYGLEGKIPVSVKEYADNRSLNCIKVLEEANKSLDLLRDLLKEY